MGNESGIALAVMAKKNGTVILTVTEKVTAKGAVTVTVTVNLYSNRQFNGNNKNSS